MSTEAHSPPFEQLPALAYVEVDRFCDHCSYNLRGQPVRRDPATRLALTRCPECGAFHPANQSATALSLWTHRYTVVTAWSGWILFCVFLLAFAIGGQVGVMGSIIEDLGRAEARFERYYYNYGQPGLEDRGAWELAMMRWAGIIGSAAIGLVSVMIWTVIFPHWRRWGYRAMAFVGPLIGAIIIGLLIWLEEMRRLPHDTERMLLAMFTAHLGGGLLGSVTGRPVTRGLLTLFLPVRQRAIFAYLWMVDGRKPPHAAPTPGSA